MNKMTYKGYLARVDFDDRGNILVGRVLGLRDQVSFHAETITGLHAAFEEAVDDYLETCAQIGKSPEKPSSGKMMLRVPPEIHTAALVAAQSAGMSLNQWAANVLKAAAQQ